MKNSLLKIMLLANILLMPISPAKANSAFELSFFGLGSFALGAIFVTLPTYLFMNKAIQKERKEKAELKKEHEETKKTLNNIIPEVEKAKAQLAFIRNQKVLSKQQEETYTTLENNFVFFQSKLATNN